MQFSVEVPAQRGPEPVPSGSDDAGLLARLIQGQRRIGATNLDPAALMATIADVARELTDADAGVVELRRDGDMVYEGGAGTAAAYAGLRVPVDASLSGLCARTGRSLTCPDIQTDDRVDREACRRLGVRSLVMVPLTSEAEVVGVAMVCSRRTGAFRATDVALLEVVGGMAGAALAHAAEHQALRRLIARRISAIGELRRDRARLTEQVGTDELTGVASRQGVTTFLADTLEASSAAVVYVDLDRFKRVNDEHGHEVGDRVLASTAARLRATVRDGDVVGRIGGDEFVVVSPNLTEQEAPALARRLAAAAAHEVRHGETVIEVTASVGVAWVAAGRSPAEALHHADEDMYARKRARE